MIAGSVMLWSDICQTSGLINVATSYKSNFHWKNSIGFFIPKPSILIVQASHSKSELEKFKCNRKSNAFEGKV